MPFEKWLSQEKYDEADRRVQGEQAAANDNAEPKDAEVRRRRNGADDAAEAAEHARSLSLAAIEISVPRNTSLIVRDATIEDRDGNTWLAMMTDVGTVALLIEGNNASLQDEGQAHLGRLAEAAGAEINEPADVIGCTFMIVGDTFADVALAA